MTGLQLKNIYKSSGLSGDDFALKLGVTRTYMYELFRLKTIDKYHVDNLQKTDKKNTVLSQKTLPLIPIEAIAGYANGEMPFTNVDIEQYIVPEFAKIADYLIRISGNSMAPKYYNGDVVACKQIPKDTFIQWNRVYILDTVQGALCKRLHQSPKKGYIQAVSDNTKYPAFDIAEKEIRSLAIVVGVIRLE